MMIRLATRGDARRLVEIQRAVYGDPDLIESSELFGEIIDQRISYVALQGHTIIGFILVHATEKGRVHPLHTLHLHLPSPHKTTTSRRRCFIHDLTVHPDHQGRGVGPALYRHFRERHADVRDIELVAVNAKTGFWERFGFAIDDAAATTDMKELYGNYKNDQIRFMTLSD